MAKEIIVSVRFILSDTLDEQMPFTEKEFCEMTEETIKDECNDEEIPSIECKVISSANVTFKQESKK